MGQKGSQTTTTTQAPPAWANQYYQQLSQQAVNLGNQAYTPYTGQLTAPINAQQQTAIGNVNDLYPQVSGMISGAAEPLTQAQISQYYNPFQQNVINATEAQFANTNAQQFNQADANAVMAGAYGGTGNVRAKAMLAGQQQLAEAPVIAGLEQQGYTQALGTAGLQFQQNPEQAAGLLSSTGTNIANTQFGYGTAEQQTQQNALNAAYQQWLQQQAYPFQTTAFAAGEVGGLGSLAGGTGTVTAPPPSLIAQYGGLGIAGLGAYGAYQNAQAARGGRILRRQGGLVPHFASGGGPGNMPYAGALSYIPTEPLPHGAGPPHPVSTPIPNNSNQILQQATKLAGTFGRSGSRDVADDASEDAAYNSSDATFGRAYGGLVLPQRNRIEFKRGGPIRAGLGFSSFVPRRGYQYGGSPEELAAEGVPATFDERFPTQPGLAPADFDARFQGQSPDLDGGTIMQPGLEPPAVVSPPASAPQAGTVQTAGVGQEEAPDIVTKGPEAVSRGRATWEAKARRAAEAEGIDPNVFAGIIHQESGFNPNVRPSSAGAIGIAQFMPKTAADMGVDPHNPETSLPAAARYFKQLLKDFNGDYPKAIAAYNAGPGRVASGAPLPAETQAYVPAVMAFAGQGAQGAGTAAGLATDEDGYTTTPPPRGRTSGLATGQERPSGGKGPFGMNSDVSMALMAAGLGMAASRSPFPGVAIGEGGLAGLGAYGSLQRQHLVEAQLERQNAREAEQERHARAQEGFEQTKLTQISPAEKAKLELERQKPTTVYDPSIGQLRTVTRRPDGGLEDVFTHEVLGAPSLPGVPGAPATPASTGKTTASRAPIQLASADPGFRVRNSEFVESGQSYNYATDAPHMEKGMVVPEPQAFAGNSVDSLKTDAATYLQSGKLPQVSRGQSPVAVAQQAYQRAVKNYANTVAASRGMSPEQIAETMRQGPMMPRFILGPAGQATVSLGTAVRHLDTLQQLADAWQADPNSRTVNRIREVLSREFGGTAATNLTAASQIVGPEIVKAIGVAGAGTAAERGAAEAWANPITTPDQLKGAVQTTQKLLAGQLEGKRRQAAASGVSEETFKNLIGERPFEILTNVDKRAAPTSSGSAPKAFDRDAAKKAGYTDKEIDNYLAGRK